MGVEVRSNRVLTPLISAILMALLVLSVVCATPVQQSSGSPPSQTSQGNRPTDPAKTSQSPNPAPTAGTPVTANPGLSGAAKPAAGDQVKSAESKPEAKNDGVPLPSSAELMRRSQLGNGHDGIQLGTEIVQLAVTVTDPMGRFVTGLDKSHFEVYEDKIKQKVEFFSDVDAPVSLGIIFDVSGSMKSRINRSHEALQKFIDSSQNDDDYFLVGFNSTAKLIQDFTSNGQAIATALTMVEAKGSTALYDAVYLGVEKVRQGRHKRRAIIIISDGQDNDSRYTYRELRKVIKETDVQIYALGITDLYGPGALDMEGQAILEEIARTTGGRAFFPHNDLELEDGITKIALELRHQYSLAYVSQDASHDGRYRKLRVVVNPPKGLPHLMVRAREGYFAQKPMAPATENSK